MELVRQKESNHCAVAALSMGLALPYDDVLNGLGKAVREKGVNELHVRQYLSEVGRPIRQIYEHDITNNFKPRGYWPPKPFASAHCCYVNPSHWVAMAPDGEIFDPARGRGFFIADYSVYSVIGIYPVYSPHQP